MNPSKARQQGCPKFYSERDLCQVSCKTCNDRLTSMRKTAVRWLYMEWYKKAVLGQTLPSVQELTPTILAVLQVVHKEKYKERGKLECSSCQGNLDSLVSLALAPLGRHPEMHSASLPRNFSLASASGRYHVKEAIQLGPQLKPLDKSFGSEIVSNLEAEVNEDDGGTKFSGEEETDNDLSVNSSAASFFFRAAQRLSLSSKRRRKSRRNKTKDSDAGSSSAQEHGAFPTNFSDLIMRCPPQAPPSLFKHTARKSGESNGKVKVILRVSDLDDSNSPSCLKLDPKKKQAFLCDLRDANVSPRLGKEAKLYQFDSMFDSKATKPEICSSTLVDLLHTVINSGDDASLVVYGHPNLGKSSTMVGKDDKSENLGIIPCAISWLYQLIEDRKERTGARFSVRVSAVEIVGKSENLKDLLGDQASGSVNNCSTSPSLYLQRERTGPVQFSDFTELRAPSAEKASFYFDAAIASKTQPLHEDTNIDPSEDPFERQNSNMIFTFHVYQYLIDKVGTGEIHGGRSRFHLIDLSGCKRSKRSKDSSSSSLSLSNLGNVLVALSNGAKHIPHRDSKLTVLLREAFGALSSRIALTAFVSGDPKKYPETLSTMEVTTRIHRSRKKKSRYSSGSSGGDSSCDESRRVRRRPKPVQPMLITRACESDTIGDSEFTTSAAEDSCDTVIYVGPKGRVISDNELTDFEGPPSSDLTSIYKSLESLKSKEKSTLDNEINIKPDGLENNEKYPLDGQITIDEDGFENSGECNLDDEICLKSDGLTKSNKSLSVDRIDLKPEIMERNCSCSSNQNFNSNTCIHTTSMKHVDTDYSSQLSLLASFSDTTEKLPPRPLSENAVHCSVQSFGDIIGRSSVQSLNNNDSRCHSRSEIGLRSPVHSVNEVGDSPVHSFSVHTLTPSLSKEDLASFCISDDAREALSHPSSPYYYLLPGCTDSDSGGIINNFVQRRNRPMFHSLKARPSSEKYSSQEQLCTASSRGRSCNRDLSITSPAIRTSSLDRYFIRSETQEDRNENCLLRSGNSNESLASSQGTVFEFERDLVSKIVERFDVEQEIADMEPDLVSSYLEKEQRGSIGDNRCEYFKNRLSTDESIIVTVTSQERLDPTYIDSLNLTDTLRKQREASFSEFLKSTSAVPDFSERTEMRDNETDRPWEPRSEFAKDSATTESFKEQDRMRGTASRLDSASSCGSLLVIPKAIGLASEGVSSGYESMRCESSGNLNTVSDLDSERGKCKSNKKDKKSLQSKGKDKKAKETPSIPESGVFNIEDQFDKSRFGRGKAHKKDVKALIGERKSMKESLQHVLRKLVLLKDPVSDVDERLKGLALDDPQAIRTLSRENKILKRKVDVCKSHLQLVTCFDSNPQSVVTTAFLYKTTAV